jgi:hypothetical protein
LEADGSLLNVLFYSCRTDLSFEPGPWRYQYWDAAESLDAARVIRFRQGEWYFGIDAVLRPGHAWPDE